MHRYANPAVGTHLRGLRAGQRLFLQREPFNLVAATALVVQVQDALGRRWKVRHREWSLGARRVSLLAPSSSALCLALNDIMGRVPVSPQGQGPSRGPHCLCTFHLWL